MSNTIPFLLFQIRPEFVEANDTGLLIYIWSKVDWFDWSFFHFDQMW